MGDGYASPGRPPPGQPTAPRDKVDYEPRCTGSDELGNPCRTLLGRMLTRPWVVDCRKCKHRNHRT